YISLKRKFSILSVLTSTYLSFIGIFITLPISDKKRMAKASTGENPSLIKAVFITFIIKKPISKGKKSIRIMNSGLNGGKKTLSIKSIFLCLFKSFL
ncbi:MAG: hypothetical protein ACTSSA_10330, partial [Candidatus Freyarchaeota archaeon]